MAGISEYERLQIASLTNARPAVIVRKRALHLMPQTDLTRLVFETCVIPAMARNELDAKELEVVFDSDSPIANALAELLRAEVIVADVSDFFADVAYLVGLCHGVGRSPILIARKGIQLPFGLDALRCIEYRPDTQGYHLLREELTRALRIFLTASRATGQDKIT